MAPSSPAAALLRAIRTNPGISRSPRLLHKACLRHTRIFRISCARTMRHAGVSLRVAVAVRPIGSPDRSNLHPGCCSLDRSCDFQARKRPIFRVIGPNCVSERTGWTDRAILRKRPACCKTKRQTARRSHCLSGPPSFQRQTCHDVRRLGCRTLPMLPPRALRRISSGVAQSQCFVAFTNRSANTPAHAVPPAKARRPGRVERVRQEKGADDGVRIR